MVGLLFLIFPVAQCRLSGVVHPHGGCRSQREYVKGPQVIVFAGEGRTCFQAAAGTIQEAVADDSALHSRLHLVPRGLEFWFRLEIWVHAHPWPDTDQAESFYEI